MDDVAKFDSVVASDFYLFDGGARFPGNSIVALIKAQHDAGKTYQWNVSSPTSTSAAARLGSPMSMTAALPMPQAPRSRNGRNLPFCRADGVWKIMVHAQHPRSGHVMSSTPASTAPD
ncbi:MAG: hypothetical protein WDN69_02585 [Aliidongia sp.]